MGHELTSQDLTEIHKLISNLAYSANFKSIKVGPIPVYRKDTEERLGFITKNKDNRIVFEIGS